MSAISDKGISILLLPTGLPFIVDHAGTGLGDGKDISTAITNTCDGPTFSGESSSHFTSPGDPMISPLFNPIIGRFGGAYSDPIAA